MKAVQNDRIRALIDTTQIKLVRVGLRLQGKEFWVQEIVDITKPQQVLPMLLALLATHSKSLSDLGSVEVYKGPGSYTGLRVGFAVANSLGYLLGISVNDNPVGQAALPIYETD